MWWWIWVAYYVTNLWFYFISPKDFVNNLLLLLLDKEPVSIKKYIKKWCDVFCSCRWECLAGLILCRFWHWVLFENFIGCVFMKGIGEGGWGEGLGPSSETQEQSGRGRGRKATRRMLSRMGKELLRSWKLLSRHFVAPDWLPLGLRGWVGPC